MFFASDNWAGAHPKIAEHLVTEAGGYAAAYGNSDLDRKIEGRFAEIFEREVAVFFVSTGTAANSLALASVQRPGGVAFCHPQAHVVEDECGAPDFFSSGRLALVEGANGKIDPQILAERIGHYPQDSIHHGRAASVTITQATEIGTIYTLDEIAAISTVARANDLPLHMDGARFANALVALDTTPAEMTWKRGVDIVSFGGTKNGCWCAEAILFFNPDHAKDMHFIRKRGAQLFSKSRFVSAQLEGYFDNDLWLDLARHANAMADRLRSGLEQTAGAKLAWSTTSNEVFAVVGKAAIDRAREKGAQFYDWPIAESNKHLVGPDEGLIRLVTSFATTDANVGDFLACLA